MAEATIALDRDGDVAVVTLSNPPLNLFADTSFDELMACLDEIEGSGARALVWRAEGDIFSGGVDVKHFQRVVEAGPAAASAMAAPLIAGVRRLEALSIPTLALVHGVCLTAGLVVGLTPGAGGTQRIAERAGPGRAREFVMTGGLYDAATLERWGVVNRIVEDGTVHEKGMRFAHRLASGPTVAHGATKRIVRAYLEGGIERADEVTPGQFAGLFASEDLRGAVRSFLDEGPGKATFEGR